MPGRLIVLVGIVSGLALLAVRLLDGHPSPVATSIGVASASVAAVGLIILVRAVVVLERRENGR